METKILHNDELQIAADIIRSGGVIAVPTETVYGLSADGFSGNAVDTIYEIKGRPRAKPINMLVPNIEAALPLWTFIPKEAFILSEKFWPGPLTIILPKSNEVPDIVTAGLTTVGARCPDHPLTLSLLNMLKIPLATPSANPSGDKSPKSLNEVLSYFDGKIPAIIDGGECTVGIESTIVDLSTDKPVILRIGGLEPQKIYDALL